MLTSVTIQRISLGSHLILIFKSFTFTVLAKPTENV